MKKQYSTPNMTIVNINSSDIICTSLGFGNGETNTMNSRGFGEFLDDEDDIWDGL